MGIFSKLFAPVDKKNMQAAISEGALLVDVRTPEEFSTGSVKGAINIPLHNIPAKLNQFKGSKNIIVFCRSGSRSAQAKTILVQNGFLNTINGGTRETVARALALK